MERGDMNENINEYCSGMRGSGCVSGGGKTVYVDGNLISGQRRGATSRNEGMRCGSVQRSEYGLQVLSDFFFFAFVNILTD